ncbi:Shugoshin-like 2, partial [Podiceps cristatus]
MQNKSLIEIEAFLNYNLLAAIEISSLSENLQSSVPPSAGPSSPTNNQFKSTCQSARSVELPMKLPLIATADPEQQDSSSVQLCTELTCNSAFLTHVKNTQSLRQSEELTKQYNDSSLPFFGNVSERRKPAVLHKSKTQPDIKDFDKKCSSNNLAHHGINSSSNTNDMNLQESLSYFSCIIPSPLEFGNESKIDFKKMLFIDQMKPEETVYDADMELTTSDAGELLTVTTKDKAKLHQNKNSNANSDKILANFRKVKYFKRDKEKIKSKIEVSSDLYAEERQTRADDSKVSKTTDSETQLFQSQKEQLPTGNSEGQQSLLNTS